MSRLTRFGMTLVAALAAPFPAVAQEVSQEVELAAGWNSVYLELEPSETSTAALVARFPQIVSVWSYDNRFGGERAYEAEEFAELDIESPPVRVKKRWRVFHPTHPEVSDLFHVHGSRAYLIRLQNDAETITWSVRGTPVPARHHWVPEDYTLTGFPVDRSLDLDARPTFAEYFAGSPVHLAPGSAVYELTGPGALIGPIDRDTERIQPGRAYFVYTDGPSDYRGSVVVGDDVFEGFDFGTESVRQDLELRNAEDEAVTVVLELTAALPSGDNAGTPVILYHDIGDREWKPLTEQGVPLVIPAKSRRIVRLQAKRQGLAPVLRKETAARRRGAKGVEGTGCYQGVIGVRTNVGTLESVPVCMEVDDMSGLWIGTVELEYVRLITREAPPTDDDGRGIPDPQRPGKFLAGGYTIPSDFPDPERDRAPALSFPLIVHVDGEGSLTLLHQAAVLWKNGIADDPDTPLDEFEPGRYVVLTREGIRRGLVESLGLVGGTLRDGRQASVRKTAPTFPGDFTLERLGAGNGTFDGSGTFTTDIVLPALHPLNPFLHRYHPDHGHPKVLRTDSNVPPKGGVRVERTLWLGFDSQADPRSARTVEVENETYSDPTPPGWGDQVIGGVYREVIESLTYDPVIVSGTFRLFKSVRSVKVLNDGVTLE